MQHYIVVRIIQIVSNSKSFQSVVSKSKLLLSLWSKYQVVVEEERPRRLRRSSAEILRCYPVPVHFQNATLLDSQYYFSAELPPSELRMATPFCVGQSDSQSHRKTDRQSLSQSFSSFCVLCVQVTTGPTMDTGMLLCCLIKVMGFTIRLSAPLME